MKAGSKRISCMGIIGDGCGGGREFIVENGILSAYDVLTKQNITLLENIHDAKRISKKACILSIECENELIEFNLSSMKSQTKS